MHTIKNRRRYQEITVQMLSSTVQLYDDNAAPLIIMAVIMLQRRMDITAMKNTKMKKSQNRIYISSKTRSSATAKIARDADVGAHSLSL